MFDLEKAIKSWLRGFRKHKAFNHGAVREMELHLRDHIDDLVRDGQSEQEAFYLAVAEFGDIRPMAKEEFWNLQPGNSKSTFIIIAMFKNYFKIAVRNFWKHKFYTFVNVLGLTLGLTTVFMIGLFVNDELSFDQFHEKKELLHRVVENQYYDGQPVFPVAVTPTALGPSLMAEYPEVIQFTRMANSSNAFKQGDIEISEGAGYLVDHHFFDMFSFPIIKGSVASFKETINALVLNRELADKYFPNEDPIGKIIKLDDQDMMVTAVIENAPKNSHINFRYLKNFEAYLAGNPNRATSWGSNWLYTYVELAPKADLAAVNEKVIGQIKANNERSVTDIYLQPMTDIYLGSVDFTVEASIKGEMIYVQIFSIVAVFILLISCINFMNLSTARSAKRAKEVGLRKTIGARREQLIIQFLSESVLLTVISVVLSVLLIALVLPSFNQLANKEFSLSTLLNAGSIVQLAVGILIMAFFTGIVAGSYPAVFLSSAKPISTLNSQTVNIKGGAGLRKLLVVVQFVISIVLIVGTMVIYNQLSFIQNVDLGYNKENIVYTSIPGEQSTLFANELRDKPGIVNVGISNRHPAYVLSSTSGFQWPGQNPDESILIHYMGMDAHYASTMGMTILEGRGFLESDTAVVMINEKARQVMGLDEPLGKSITASGDRRIVGVVKDFNFKSIHSEIEPIVIFKLDQLTEVYIKYLPTEEETIVSSLEAVWNEVLPNDDFEYYFLEKDFDELYEAEQRTSTLSTYFAGLAIIISCLGLFGLVSYAMEQRMKEIGIRKALGASVKNLFLLLTADFTKLVIISLFVALPIGWYAMGQWLDGFAYRIDLSMWVFLLAAVAAMAITMLTISYQSVRASRRSPVTALRND